MHTGLPPRVLCQNVTFPHPGKAQASGQTTRSSQEHYGHDPPGSGTVGISSIIPCASQSKGLEHCPYEVMGRGDGRQVYVAQDAAVSHSKSVPRMQAALTPPRAQGETSDLGQHNWQLSHSAPPLTTKTWLLGHSLPGAAGSEMYQHWLCFHPIPFCLPGVCSKGHCFSTYLSALRFLG